MGSVFLPAQVMDPLVNALGAGGLATTVAAPQSPGTETGAAAEYVAAARGSGATVAIAHSNAGNFVPAVVAGSAVQRVIFMDAVVPPLGGGSWPVVPPELLSSLRERAVAGILPPWTQWWPRDDLIGLFPDADTFDRVDAAAARTPFSYVASDLVAPAAWGAAVECGYLAFGDTYAAEIATARVASWPVEVLELGHLGMLQDPDSVARSILGQL